MAAVSCIYSIVIARHLRNTTIQQMVSAAKLLDQTRQITIGVGNMRIAMRGISLFTLMNHPEQVKKSRTVFEASNAEVRNILEESERSDFSPEERAAVNEIRAGVNQWLARFGEFADMCASGHGDTANEVALKTMTPVMDAIQPRRRNTSER